MKTYIQKIKEHLADYKVHVLKINESGIWLNNKQQYTHILPLNLYFKNLIDEGYYKELYDIASTIKRHCNFHHLNSSQALAINLFGLMQAENDFSILQDNGIEISNYIYSKFEYKESDDTTFDFYIKTQIRNIYFEIKYTEKTIATESKSKNNEYRWSQYYEAPMISILKDTTNVKELFFSQYQLWRNIVRISNNNDIVVFVFPSVRNDLKAEVVRTIEKVKPEYAHHIKILHIDAICKSGENHDKFSSHYVEFKNKYLKF